MVVLSKLKGKTVSTFAKSAIAGNSTVETDAYSSYRKPPEPKIQSPLAGFLDNISDFAASPKYRGYFYYCWCNYWNF